MSSNWVVVAFRGLMAVIRRYDRRFWTLVLIQLIVAIGFGAAMPFVSLYLHTQLGVSMTVIGTIMLVSALVASGGRIVGGEIADRIGRRPLLLVGMSARGLSLLSWRSPSTCAGLSGLLPPSFS